MQSQKIGVNPQFGAHPREKLLLPLTWLSTDSVPG
jgi:hypothetical protein